MRILKTTLFALGLSLLLSACGSGSSSIFEGKFTTDQLSGIYSISTSSGNYSIRFAEPDETNTSGKGFLFHVDFLTLNPESITADSVGEAFDWEVSVDGQLTLNYPLSGKQERFTLTDDDKALFELDSQQDGDFEYKESDIAFTRIAEYSLISDFVDLESLSSGQYKLTTKDYIVTYNLSEIYRGESSYREGTRITSDGSEPILWLTNYINPNPNFEENEDPALLYGRIIVVRDVLFSVLGLNPTEVISLKSGNSDNGIVQFIGDYTYNELDEGFPQYSYEYIDNNASFDLIEEVAEE